MTEPPAGNGLLNGRRVLVVSAGHNLLGGVVRGLVQHGARTLLLSDTEAHGQDGVEFGALDLSSRAAVGTSIDTALVRLGAPDLVALSIVPEGAVRMAPLSSWSESGWRSCAMEALRATMWIFDALGRHLKPTGAGAVVMIGPALSLVGAPDLIALSTLLEGQRGLMKSVARQWGGAGVRVNWIAAAPRALSPVFDDAPLAAKPDMVSVALGRPADPSAEIAPVLGFLASAGGRGFTGATLSLDGGEWMVP